MDEIAAAEIRKWAWKQLEDFAPKGHLAMSLDQHLKSADILAAWVMSSVIPAEAQEQP